jgi:hypothetical protein
VTNTATITCNTSGYSQTSDCVVLKQAYVACAICLFPPADSCESCRQQNCCAQMQAYWSDLDVYYHYYCVSLCTNQTCVDQCGIKYPTAASKLNTLNQCVDSFCGNLCP